MLRVLDLYLQDVGEPTVTVAGGREQRGPCPGCGGNDRFGIHVDQNTGKHSYFCGRYKGSANTGCGKGGDAIQYLRDFRGLSYVDACGFLGIDAKHTTKQSAHKYSMPKQVPQKNAVFAPESKSYPQEVVNPAIWQEHGMKFVEACHVVLLSSTPKLAYLATRGISLETVKKYKLGFHVGQDYKGKKHQPSFRPWPSWGLADEKRNGRSRMLALPAGIVIPYIKDEQLHRITIRMNQPDQNGVRYHYVKGSIRDLWLTDAGTGIFVTCEAELDCLAIDSVAADLVGTVGIGSTGVKPDSSSWQILKKAKLVLGSLDFDPARKNKKTGKIMMPGGMAEMWWKQTFGSRHKRWPVPVGKDVGEAFEAGIDIRTWIEVGVNSHREKRMTSKSTVAKVAPRPASNHVVKQEKKILPPKNCKETIRQRLTEAPAITEPAYLCRPHVIRQPLSNGYVILLTDNERCWNCLSDLRQPVFSSSELKKLKSATQELDVDQALASAMATIKIKETFGGFITFGELVDSPRDMGLPDNVETKNKTEV